MAPKPKKKQKPAVGPSGNVRLAGKFTLPPWLSYDPSIGAEMRSQSRGLQDILHDTDLAQRYAQEDASVSSGDLDADYQQGLRDIGYRQSDILKRQSRGLEDFGNQLTGLIRNFQVKGREQRQAANAAGVLPGSTSRAAAARRQEGLAIGRKPIDIGRQRLIEDSAEDMSRLVNSQADLNANYNRNRALGGTDLSRTLDEISTKRHRAQREQLIGRQDLQQQAIFDARERKPGVFSIYGTTKNKNKPRRRR